MILAGKNDDQALGRVFRVLKNIARFDLTSFSPPLITGGKTAVYESCWTA